ncbi:MAG: helix-turn-helix transcriptional regulator [Alphaproteobacteria bacterium]|nr:helix-turn-helix transcriptional regulator [Alphaproteobacteria bacterium]
MEEAAKASKMTLSVYHKIEVGQREVYENEIDILAKAFGLSTTELFDKIATLYKSGELNKQINKTKERVKSVLNPTNPRSGLDFHDGLYGAQLYDNARKKLIPVFGSDDKLTGQQYIALKFVKSDENMISAPVELEGNSHIYAVIPNTKRTGNFIPAKSFVFVDAKAKPNVGDLAVAINTNFSEMKNTDTAVAQLVYVCKDTSGKLYGKVSNPDEKIKKPCTK